MGTYDGKGNRISDDSTGIRFLYNGQYGVQTDENGLYYMRARYYNTDIKRFLNREILTGSIENSQSLNRYSYVQGNPVSMTDPFGLCPEGSGISGYLKMIDHTILDMAGYIPGIGDMLGLGLRRTENVAKLLKYTNAATKLSRGGKLLSAGCRVIGAVAQTGVNAINFSKALDTVLEEMETNGGTASWQANANLVASAIGVLIGVRQSFSSSRNFSKLRSSFETKVVNTLK